MNRSSTFLRLSLATWVKLWALGLVIWLSVKGWSLLIDVGMIVFGAFLISLAIRPIAITLAKWHVPRGLTTLLAYILLVGLLVVLGALLVPVLRTETNSLTDNGPALIQDSLAQIRQIRILRNVVPSSDALARDITQQLNTFVEILLSTATQFASLMLELFIVLVLSYFFVTDEEMGNRFITGWIPSEHRGRIRALVDDAENRLSRWVWAQLGVAVYFAVVFSAGLALLGIPFPFTIGLVGGVVEIIPYLGGITAWLLAVFSAISLDPLHVVWITLFYIAVVQIEAHVIAPTLYGKVTGIHPALVLIALTTGAKAKGILGVLFAVPVVIVAIVLVEELRTILVPPDDSLEPGEG